MKYLGWILSILLAVGMYYTYRTKYLPLMEDVSELREEISMWEDVLKGEKGIKGERQRFTTERFFTGDRLTPFAEVEILRKFDMRNKGIEIYLTAPKAFTRAGDLLRFLAEQHINYKNLSLFVVVDSTERFEYKFIK
ncbi:hypothetical protein AMJ83_04575 [candidate division WOR_3 bacterium SM23_42]|uniref:Uncharacterized protein n=1 Tax=candidate division WOR_3 bacterium SM23_42 TaxID=1703779 RepID=A0A0S8FT48_UNCW3|nr:MAG: hypothetical protein AMJ83_04575 [candidate division WOR_3 bacterium SM23_42]